MRVFLCIIAILVAVVALFFGSIYLYCVYLKLKTRKRLSELFPVDYTTHGKFTYMGKKFDEEKYVKYRIEKYEQQIADSSIIKRLSKAKQLNNTYEFSVDACDRLDTIAKKRIISKLQKEIDDQDGEVRAEQEVLISEAKRMLENNQISFFDYGSKLFDVANKLKSEKAKLLLEEILQNEMILVEYIEMRSKNAELYKKGVHICINIDEQPSYVGLLYDNFFKNPITDGHSEEYCMLSNIALLENKIDACNDDLAKDKVLYEINSQSEKSRNYIDNKNLSSLSLNDVKDILDEEKQALIYKIRCRYEKGVQ